jgi:hypothetical protein
LFEVKRYYMSLISAVGILALLSLLPLVGQDGPPAGAAKGKGGKGGPKQRAKGAPVTRTPDGKVDFGGPGVWGVPYVTNMEKASTWGGTDVEPPFRPFAKELYDQRVANFSKDDPEGYCLPPGVPRMMYTPYPMEVLQTPNRWVFIYEGGAHVWRSVPIGPKEGLKHPADPNPTYLGDSYGYWDGDTMVIDVVGFNDRTWLDFAGHPHGEKLHVIERYTREDSLNLKYTATIDDPEYYTKPWDVTVYIPYRANDHLTEYICQENNRDTQHLVGK